MEANQIINFFNANKDQVIEITYMDDITELKVTKDLKLHAINESDQFLIAFPDVQTVLGNVPNGKKVRPNKVIYFDQILNLQKKIDLINKFVRIIFNDPIKETLSQRDSQNHVKEIILFVKNVQNNNIIGFDLTNKKNNVEINIELLNGILVPLDPKNNANVIIPLLKEGEITNVKLDNDSFECSLKFSGDQLSAGTKFSFKGDQLSAGTWFPFKGDQLSAGTKFPLKENIWDTQFVQNNTYTKTVLIEYLVNGEPSNILEWVIPSHIIAYKGKCYVLSYSSFPFCVDDVMVKQVEDLIDLPTDGIGETPRGVYQLLSPEIKTIDNPKYNKSVTTIVNNFLLSILRFHQDTTNIRVEILNIPGEYVYFRKWIATLELFKDSYLANEKYPYVTIEQIKHVITQLLDPTEIQYLETKHLVLNTEVDLSIKQAWVKNVQSSMSFNYLKSNVIQIYLNKYTYYIKDVPLVVNQLVKVRDDNGYVWLCRVVDNILFNEKYNDNECLGFIYSLEKIFHPVSLEVETGFLRSQDSINAFYPFNQGVEKSQYDMGEGDWVVIDVNGSEKIDKVKQVYYVKNKGGVSLTILQLENGLTLYVDRYMSIKLALANDSSLPDLANFLINLYEEVRDMVKLPEDDFYLYDEEVNHKSVSKTFDALNNALLDKFKEVFRNKQRSSFNRVLGNKYSYLETEEDINEFDKMINYLLDLCRAFDKYQKGTLQKKYEDMRKMMNNILACNTKEECFIGLDMEMYKTKINGKDKMVVRENSVL